MTFLGSNKIKAFVPVEVTTGGNVAIDTGAYTLPGSLPADDHTLYYFHGTKTLTSDLDVISSSKAYPGVSLTILYNATLTLSGNSFTIFGKTVPSELAAKPFAAHCFHNGSSFDVHFALDITQSGIIGSSLLAADAITTAKILDANVTLAKLEALTSAQIIVGNSSNRPTAVSMSGDVTISNTGVTTIGSGAVDNSMLASGIDAAKITTGTLPNARLSSVPSTALADLGKLYSKYSDTGTGATTVEETLGSYTLPGGTVASDGQGVRIVIAGTFAANADAKTIRLKVGGTTYATNSVTTLPNGVDFYATLELLRSGATSAVGFSNLTVGAVSQGIQKSKGGITWASDNDIATTGQNGVATLNDIVLSLMTVEIIK